jgi:hypothetical protein
VDVQSRAEFGGRQKRADYLFRTDGHDRKVHDYIYLLEELKVVA